MESSCLSDTETSARPLTAAPARQQACTCVEVIQHRFCPSFGQVCAHLHPPFEPAGCADKPACCCAVVTVAILDAADLLRQHAVEVWQICLPLFLRRMFERNRKLFLICMHAHRGEVSKCTSTPIRLAIDDD